MENRFDLQKIYNQIDENIKKLDFTKIWPGFTPLKFALYTEDTCYYNGSYVERTDEFYGNTAIEYNGEYIGIWMIEEDIDPIILTSKIIHEMFHGYQQFNNWDGYADEMEALFKYRYNSENLGIKLHENKLLLELLSGHNEEKYRELLKCRKYRSLHFPYEFDYECKVEDREGTATFVEWNVLMQLDAEKADKFIENIRKSITNPKHFFPIRIPCYDIGTLMINAMINADSFDYESPHRPVMPNLLNSINCNNDSRFSCASDSNEVTESLNTYIAETKSIIEKALRQNEVVLTGPFELIGVNVYDARCYDGYITTTYFLMYSDNGENKILNGNYVIKMRDSRTLETVYQA